MCIRDRNAAGVLSRRAEMAAFATEYDLDVILLSETHLTPALSLQLPAYTTYRTDRPAQNMLNASGSTAVLVHRRIAHRPLPPPATRRLEVTVVALSVGGREVRLASVYLPPGRGGPPPAEEWDALLEYPLSTITAGDFNCKDPLWNSRVSNPYGRSLYSYAQRHPQVNVLGPTSPTYVPHHRGLPDVLDIVVVKDLACPISCLLYTSRCV